MNALNGMNHVSDKEIQVCSYACTCTCM